MKRLSKGRADMNLLATYGFMAAALAMATGCTRTAEPNVGAPAEGKIIASLNNIQNVLPDQLRFGDKTTKRGPTSYKAEYDVLVYFGFDANMDLVSSIQYFAASGEANLSPEDEFSRIKTKMMACVATLDAAPAGPSPTCQGAIMAANFDNFTFRAPSNMVFVSKNATLKFGAEPIVIGKTILRPGLPARPNKAFYDAKVHEDAIGTRQMVYVRNYYSKKSGGNGIGNGPGDTPIGNGKYWYGTNIFMTANQQGGRVRLPIIIDPDTGNMGGNP